MDVTFSRAQIDRNNEFSDFVSGFESKPSEGVARDVLQIIDAAERDNMREYEYIAQRLKTNFLYLPEEEQDQINEWLTDRDLQKIFL
ncbi:MAG: hypothetical protein BRD50_02190 [Bacteroidetes bacterium SW_11_45_7]|nr:MAG: hypothetical protein BRD50_02190 [Bacteroidetes bacterium SW_11_45_7]